VRKLKTILEILYYLFNFFQDTFGGSAGTAVRKQGSEEVENHIRNIILFI